MVRVSGCMIQYCGIVVGFTMHCLVRGVCCRSHLDLKCWRCQGKYQDLAVSLAKQLRHSGFEISEFGI